MNFDKQVALKWVQANLVWFCVTLTVALLLKHHYSVSSSDALRWILQPTAGLVEVLSNTPFILERGEGYVNYSNMLIIAKSCAGINFLILTICMMTYHVIPLLKNWQQKIVALVGIGITAYLVAIVANTVRILIAMQLYAAKIHFGFLTPDRLHRMEGIAVYFGALWLMYAMIQKLTQKNSSQIQGGNTCYA